MATRTHKLLAAGTAVLIAEPAFALAHTGGVGVIVGLAVGAIAYHAVEDVEAAMGKELPSLPAPGKREKKEREPGRLSFGQRLLTGRSVREAEERQEEAGQSAEGLLSPEDALFRSGPQRASIPEIDRLTIEQIIAHTTQNGFTAYIGRSLTQLGHPAVAVGFYKRHMKLIGASQKGKSSMAAALLKIILATHDTQHVLVAILDKENRTGNLFNDDPHIIQVKRDGQLTALHGRSNEDVLAHLETLVEIMDYRYGLPAHQLDDLPLIIIYLEEFLSLKKYFKARAAGARKEEKDRAAYEYERLVWCISELARRGLKAHMQLLICTQVDYRDEDLQEALVNVTAGIAFCVKPTAATAAGFYQSELLARNARDNIAGVGVAEFPDCTDLVVAPECDVEAQLRVLSRRSPVAEPRFGAGMGVPPLVNVNVENVVNEPVKPVNASVNASEYSPAPENIPPAFTQAEETQVLLAYAETLKSGKPVTRTGIRDLLDWDNKQYQRIIKPVCDKHHIG
jgi:hypothetical protein